MIKQDWADLSIKYHEQTHIYWRTLFGVPILVTGWAATASKIDLSIAWLITILLVILQTLFTRAVIKVYRLMQGALGELKKEYSESYTQGPFAEALLKLSPLGEHHIIGINLAVVSIACASIIIKASS